MSITPRRRRSAWIVAASAACALVWPITTGTAMAEPQARSTVLVHGTDLPAAQRAVAESGLRPLSTLTRIGVIAASGTERQIAAATAADGVTHIERDRPLRLFGRTDGTGTPGGTAATGGTRASDSTGTIATRSTLARHTLRAPDGRPLDGHGVGIAVIDTGISPHHPAFHLPDGSSKVVRNIKSLCVLNVPGCLVDLPSLVETDAVSLGGHGTHVSGIAAGNPGTLPDGTRVGGAAPGARLVSISVGLGQVLLGADIGLNWVLEHHRAPCGPGVPASVCPPIRVVNNSYGSAGEFDPSSAQAKLQRALAAEGVVTVWANGNSGGDGSVNRSNPPGSDSTPGVVSVASYNDQGTGSRHGSVSAFSSRGARKDPASWPDISAPGERIISSCRWYLPICASATRPRVGSGLLAFGEYNTLNGTSMAAPQVSGVVAQLFQAAPRASAGRIEHALKSTAHRYTDGAPYTRIGRYLAGFDKGTGLVDTVAAARSLGARSDG